MMNQYYNFWWFWYIKFGQKDQSVNDAFGIGEQDLIDEDLSAGLGTQVLHL